MKTPFIGIKRMSLIKVWRKNNMNSWTREILIAFLRVGAILTAYGVMRLLSWI